MRWDGVGSKGVKGDRYDSRRISARVGQIAGIFGCGFQDKYFHYGRICITLVNQSAINLNCQAENETEEGCNFRVSLR